MLKSKAASLASLPEDVRKTFLDDLTENALAAMPFVWDVWANPLHQTEPEGDSRDRPLAAGAHPTGRSS